MEYLDSFSVNCSQGTISTEMQDFSYSVVPLYKLFQNEGNLAWEYNPLRNYRVNATLYQVNEVNELVDADRKPLGTYKGYRMTKASVKNLLYYKGIDAMPTGAVPVQEPMELSDFTTEKLGFDLNHPVQMECQPSYDGSVNLILNDGKNPPRMINSRFTPMENNTYKIVNRIGNNDTNIYDDEEFETDTSLYKRISRLPKLVFNGIEDGGACLVGNYVFYFKYEDADGNQTDFVTESGVVTCHAGGVNDIFSIKGGIADESSNKMVKFTLRDVDPGYSYVRVYYTRTTSDIDGVRVSKNHVIEQRYIVKDTSCPITITGYEPTAEVPGSEINVQYNLVGSAKTAAQCQNMLFMGNIDKVDVPYEELADLSLRVYPIPVAVDTVGGLSPDYQDTSNQFEYYNAMNLYNKLGYWDDEIYRIGIVYVMPDYSLSPVFNTRGRDQLEVATTLQSDDVSERYTSIPAYEELDKVTGKPVRIKITTNEGDYAIFDKEGNLSKIPLENSRGVIRITTKDKGACQIQGKAGSTVTRPIGLRIAFDGKALQVLKTMVKGFFIVRQKRIPTILAQAFTVGLDKNACIPLLYVNNIDGDGKQRWVAERFLDDERLLSHDFKKRLYNYPAGYEGVMMKAAICPEAELNLPYFNQLFTGAKYTVTKPMYQPKDRWLECDPLDVRHSYVEEYAAEDQERDYAFTSCKVTMVHDDSVMTTSGTQKYAGRAGNAEEAWRLRYLMKDDVDTEAVNLVRGSYGTYIGLEGYDEGFGRIINIRIPGYDVTKMRDYFSIRYNDKSAYYPVTDRISMSSVGEDSVGYYLTAYRGDCYICNYTHRMNRNFQDPEAPNNDVIVNENSWKDNYDVSSKEKNENINRGDVNAVRLGHWLTFKLCANVNLSMRTTDDSHYEENGLTGLARGFYPLHGRSVTGEAKIPESSVMNAGMNATTGAKVNFLMPDVPYLKDVFSTRVMYSDIFVNDSYRNGYRVYRLNHFRDYATTYGGLVKLVGFGGFLVAVFEHGTAAIPVNERALAGEGTGGAVFVNTSNVLPENPKMLSGSYGSQWAGSVEATPNHVYGIDTVAKKIWRTNGSSFEVISDFKVQQFLNRNITLKEREMTPVVGVRDVRTHYNAFKQDVMFTFYDNLYGFEEKAWNLCFNEVLGKFVTFYSWLPSFSANIDNCFFTFDRDVSKMFSKFGVGTTGNPAANGITVEDPLDSSKWKLSISNRYIPGLKGITPKITYEIGKDQAGFWRYFKIEGDKITKTKDLPKGTVAAYVNIRANVDFEYSTTDQNLAQYVTGWKERLTANDGYYSNTVALLAGELGKDATYFWKHGRAGLIDIADKTRPCMWYGRQHPFEYQFVVAENPSVQKIFSNMLIISNNVQPESLHLEITGENYTFANELPNAYFRQEATKELYQNLGCDLLFDRDYKEIAPKQNAVSVAFPWYYERIDTFDELYDSYQLATSGHDRDYQNLTGTEVSYDHEFDSYGIIVHQKVNSIVEHGRLRGNIHYKENLFNVELRPLYFIMANEDRWPEKDGKPGVPPILLDNVPKITKTEITEDDLPEGYDITDIAPDANGVYLEETGWTDRRPARLRDKFIIIRARYAGDKVAFISAVKTMYNFSYA